jgi:hypothetical protein
MRQGNYPASDGLQSFTVNSYGLRGKEFSIPKPAQIYRIVIFGGSSTFGGQSPEGETYPEYLEKILRHRLPPKNIEVINYGLSSKSMYYLATHYFKEIEQLQADMVIFNNVRNTVFYDPNFQIVNYGDILTKKHYFLTKINFFLNDNMLLYRLIKKSLRSLEIKKIPVDQQRYFLDELYFPLLKEIYTDTKRQGIILVNILEPAYSELNKIFFSKTYTEDELRTIANDYYEKNAGKTDDENRSNGVILSMHYAYNQMRKLSKEHPEIILIDPSIELFKAENQDDNSQIFSDYIHLTSQGNKILAEIIANKIEAYIK